REKAGEGLATHGSNVAEAASKTAVAHAASGMPLAAKVHVFNGKVSGDEKFVAGGKAHYRTVIADALHHGAIAASGGETANALNQLLFTGNQDEVNYIEEKGLTAEKARLPRQHRIDNSWPSCRRPKFSRTKDSGRGWMAIPMAIRAFRYCTSG